VADMLAARSNFAVGVIDGVLFAIGGFNGQCSVAPIIYIMTKLRF